MEKYDELQKIIENAKNIVFFGGAGVSTESGIPDFRGNTGLYTTKFGAYSPEEMLHHDFFFAHPKEFYEYYRTNMIYPEAKPNKAHRALAALERQGKLGAVITQNIDGLHQKGGSENVIELHGSTLSNYCTRCGKRYGIEAVISSEGVPVCAECGALVRPDVVLYGEQLPAAAFSAASAAIKRADVLIVGGTSLTVYPAAGLVGDYRGEHLIIINKTPTPYDCYAELVIREPIGNVFGALTEQ